MAEIAPTSAGPPDFRRIFHTLRVPAAGAGADGAIAFANAAFLELAGPREPSLAGRGLASLFAAADRKRVQQNVARVGEGKAASAFFDAQLLQGDGTPRWVSVALQPWLDGRDQPSGVVVVLQEIGAQREADRALSVASARLLALAETAPAPILVETAEGEVELVNERFCRLAGLEAAPQSLTGLAVEEVLQRSPWLDASALRRLRTRGETAMSVELRPADAPAATLVRHPVVVDDTRAGAVWTTREAVGGRLQPGAAAEVAVIERIAQELSVALEGLGTLSIRAQRSELDPSIVEHYQRIRAATETAMAAMGDLVDFSTLSGGVVLQHRPFALRDALADLVARLMPGVEERGGRMRLKVEQDVSDALEGDVERLLLVLKNLIDNAFALAPGAEITLQITPEYTTEHGIQLSFAVLLAAPAGDGLRFSPEGGMGVAMARFMVAAMGGKLAVSQRAGPEPLYSFTIEFPVRPAAAPPARPSYATLVGMPVLLVSGEAEQRDGLANTLRGWRMLPLEADNASMAMTLLERLDQEGTPVPLVILSNRLPVQDGFLLAFRIRHHPRFARTLVMMLATEGKPGDAIACRENGIAAYMRYPISDHQLHEAIQAVTGATAAADEAPTLVTRHSLRETRKGATVLLVDRHRDSQILAAHILGREDCSVVVAHDPTEALASLEQDSYDVVLVDTSMRGLDGPDAAGMLRSRIGRDAQSVRLVAVSVEHSPAFREEKLAHGFDGTMAKPFRREDMLQLLAEVRGLATAAG